VYLKRLEIQGFKTFAARTVLEFRPGTTAIVGPNGSGKSNLADAVRWVLGEQSYAALRSKRTEDLIFAGSPRRAPAGLAEVSLTIDNSDRLLPLPYGEVTITRRATRAGENEYFINRNRVRLRDIHEAIGPLGGSYTIINQGLVDAALTLKPEERRRLFEDAAEISLYQARKAEAESRLRETSANIERSADVLAELEPRLRSLKRQASLARTWREYHDELRGLLVEYYAREWRDARAARERAEAAERAQANLVAARRAEQQAAVAGVREARDALRALRERLGALHSESSALHARAEAIQRDLAVSTERLAALARREEDAARAARDVARRRDELERERDAIAARLAAAEERLAAARAAASEREAALAAGEQERRAARERIDAAQRDELAAAAARAESHRRAEALAARRAALARELDGPLRLALADAGRALAERAAAHAEADAALHAARQARAAAAAAEDDARAALDALRAARARADERAAAVRRALADLEARHESLSRLQRSYAGAFAGVRAAMQWAEQQGRAGFTLVASVLRAPPQLETAIEVALGSRLQNIVVERWDDAEDAIAALKSSGAGRATFLPLDTIRSQQSEVRRQNQPGILGIAAELVDVDPQYAPVVWNLLGRTLVVEDLATARRALRSLSGGWTIVTLAGEQVNTGGAVTGGAQIKESGTLRRERELRELPRQIEAAQAEVAARAAERAALDEQLAVAEQALREAEANRRRAAQEEDARREAEAAARREHERADAACEAARRRSQQAAAELAAIDAQRAALDEEQSALAEREAAAAARLAALRTEEQARAEADRAAQEALSQARAAAAAAEGELRAERALLQAQEQQLGRLAEQRAAAERAAAELATERAATEAQRRDFEAAHAALLAQIDDLRARIGPAEAELEALDAQRGTLEDREAALTAALLEAETAYGRAELDVQRARDRQDALRERAAAEDVDIETLPVQDDGRGTTDDGRRMMDDNGVESATVHDLPSGEPGELPLPARIASLKARIQRLGAVNPLALEEYQQESKRHAFLTTQLDDLRRAADALRALIAELDGAMQARFEATFTAIAAEFEQTFARLFGGGYAKLSLAGANGAELNGDGAHASFDQIGVEIVARPPGKRQQALSLLSGGERALTATALLFAILRVNPSPFCILDEVDAALDEANVGRFRELLGDLTDRTQFVLITHNRGTIEAADTIYGVSMGEDGASRVLSLRLEDVGVE
jgi:chromosome segregation protein